MASGQQISEQNVKAFAVWVASKTDDDFRAMAGRGVLSRREIAKECGFAKSALDQNPRIKAALRGLEDALRVRGVLPPVVEKSADEAAKPLMREPDSRSVPWSWSATLPRQCWTDWVPQGRH